MSNERDTEALVGLTSTEISNIWTAYLKNSMEQKFFEYFLSTTEDDDVAKVIKKFLIQLKKSTNELKKLFDSENLVIPLGFTDEDTCLDASRVFSDIFILYFCYDLTLLSMSTYPSALSDSTRKDARNYFAMSLEFSIRIQDEIVNLMLSKGVYKRPPHVAIENTVDFVEGKSYLSGILGEPRPFNVAEIANLSRIIHRAQFSKMVFVAFSKIATSNEAKGYFGKGRDEIQKVLDLLQEALEKENIPISGSGDYRIFDVERAPFSDKLMLYFIITCLGLFCVTMLCQAMTSCLRSDIIVKLSKVMSDMMPYYRDGLKLAIKEGWLEKPPQTIDRRV